MLSRLGRGGLGLDRTEAQSMGGSGTTYGSGVAERPPPQNRLWRRLLQLAAMQQDEGVESSWLFSTSHASGMWLSDGNVQGRQLRLVSISLFCHRCSTLAQLFPIPWLLVSPKQEMQLIHHMILDDSLSASLFPVKWQLIRDRLNRLHAGLADITVTSTTSDDDDGSDEGGRAAFAALLRGAAETARAGRDLVPRSEGRSYGGGKLRLRSDLDLLASALDAHAAALDEVHASGPLAGGARALVVPPPPPGAPRDDVRFYARDLLARARVGGARMRREAAAALADLLRGGGGGDERWARVVAAEVAADGIGVLVALMECGEAGVQEDAMDAVSVIAGFDARRADLVVGGVVAPLVRVLDSGAGPTGVRERAARVLCRLTENSDNAWAVAAHGGVTALLNACFSVDSNSSGDLACAACRVLRNLAGVDEIRKFMVTDAGAVPVLVSLIAQSHDDAARIQATELLAAMAASAGDGEGSVRDAVVQSGAIECLVHALDPSPTRSSKSREVALRAIDALCFPSSSSPTTATSTVERLLAAGFLDRVLALLRDAGDAALQHCALKSAHRLCHASSSSSEEETKKAMGDAGFMPELAAVVASQKSPEKARELAAEALCALAAVQRNRRRFVQEDRAAGVAQLVQALPRTEEKASPTTRFVLATLLHVADSSSGRRKIVSSEHFRNLEKLAEANVPDAKRLVKKLGGSKLRSIFHGIWSL
ncbi:hypothetical protein PR202_gb21248 [Eleusine coracana subsp. coracana]|uniref:DUF7032 domain-containing protein n=1 Tax=Eleusine coracana subsp. coracana TaxID=191504 RepID=A0AAV5FEA0_ELECO|nr:hypothetical protein PR202_gb21248 [Eleusine coracana subsp. coracana]